VPTVAVVGLGLMGASFALALKKARPDVVVVGSDKNPLVVRKALEREIVSSANTDLSVVEMADLVMIGAPIGAMRELFAHLAARAGGRPVSDMASTKAAVVEWAAAAAGADGLIIEVHPEPDSALSDGPQSLTLEGFDQLMRTLERVLTAVGRPLARPHSRLQMASA